VTAAAHLNSTAIRWRYALLFIAGAVEIRPLVSIPASAAGQGELAVLRLVEILRMDLTMAEVVEVVS
jgi:hypothetical protein